MEYYTALHTGSFYRWIFNNTESCILYVVKWKMQITKFNMECGPSFRIKKDEDCVYACMYVFLHKTTPFIFI